MKFRQRQGEEPEINLIPFIDVLLVILIFLMLSTSYSKFTELQITLPTASADQLKDRPKEIIVAVSADGRYAINRQVVEGRSVEMLAAALAQAAQGSEGAVDPETTITVSADAAAAHQSVMNVMDAARRVGLARLTFAAQGPSSP
ncbi:MAG TPA: biopolymer transporter ExbD [Burkholderiaceae bacterium]|nr:biopolymer transporter ExbD [Burkholderiaceae bacterium]